MKVSKAISRETLEAFEGWFPENYKFLDYKEVLESTGTEGSQSFRSPEKVNKTMTIKLKFYLSD